MSDLKTFAFNQARFVFVTMRTLECEMCQNGTNERKLFESIKTETELGKKYLANVTFDEVKREDKEPGTFMDLNTDLGKFVPDDDWNTYTADFKEH